MKILPRLGAGMLFFLALETAFGQAQIEGRVDRNVVYGMVSGAALLMDVYYPEESNGHGILYAQGSGWHAPTDYSARQLKDEYRISVNVPYLLDRGFTVFVANYRLAPTFRYPAHIQDLRRAVRFIRANASQFGIAAERLGAYGTSAGANLVGLLAFQDGVGDPNSDDPVERFSAKVQAAVIRCSGLDFTVAQGETDSVIASYLGEPRTGTLPPFALSTLWIEASPMTYLSDDDPPVLITHAMDDPIASFEAAEIGFQALRDAGLDVEFIPRETGGHCRGEDQPHERIAEWLKEKLVN
jgi:acetyl esterase/lipase